MTAERWLGRAWLLGATLMIGSMVPGVFAEPTDPVPWYFAVSFFSGMVLLALTTLAFLFPDRED